jgi:hypothetical protein
VTRAKISEYSATANDNTDVNGTNIAEGCPPSSMNNMGREIMAALKRFQVGSDGDGVTVGGSLVVSGATTLTTVSATVVQSDTVSEKTSAAGVTIDGVLLKDSGVVTGAGTVSAPVYSTTGDLNTGIFFPAADTIAFAEGGAEAMRIDSSGNVGIGTSSPTSLLQPQVNSAGNTPNLLSLVNNPGGAVVDTGVTLWMSGRGAQADSDRGVFIRAVVEDTSNSHSLRFGTSSPIAAPTERMRIDSNGRLLINTTTTDANYRVRIEGAAATGNPLRCSMDVTTGTTQIGFFNPNGAVGSIATNGSATAFNTSSDYRLKHDIQPMTGALAKVAQLKPVTYKWNADDSESQGFLAHELQEVVPECVTGEKDETEIQEVKVSPAVEATYDDDGNELTSAIEAVYEEREVPKYQGVDTSFLVATLTAAIQELKAELDEAKARIAALEQA